MRVDSTIAEVVRSTPSSAPMRSISASSSPIDAAATIAIRSNGPADRMQHPHLGNLAQRHLDGAALLRRQRDQHVGAHQRGFELVGHGDRCSPRSRAAARSRSIRLCTVVRDSPSLRASSAVGARAFSRSRASRARSVASSSYMGCVHISTAYALRFRRIVLVVSSDRPAAICRQSARKSAAFGIPASETAHEEHPRHRRRQDRLGGRRPAGSHAGRRAATPSRWPTARLRRWPRSTPTRSEISPVCPRCARRHRRGGTARRVERPLRRAERRAVPPHRQGRRSRRRPACTTST